MRLISRRSWTRGAPIWALVLGCGSGCGSDPAMMPTTMMPVPSVCANETRGDTYVKGLQKTGAQQELIVSLLQSQPGPPAIGVNTWDIQVHDAASMGGGARNDLSITAVPWMPDHMHGTSVKPTVTPTGADGRYTISDLYLYMAGLWQVTLKMQAPAATMDTVIYSFCIDSN